LRADLFIVGGRDNEVRKIWDNHKGRGTSRQEYMHYSKHHNHADSEEELDTEWRSGFESWRA